MSNAASLWTAPIWNDARTSSVPPDPPDPLISLTPLLRQWLPRQRWFAGKGRPVEDFTLVSATGLLPPGGSAGLLHLLIRTPEPGADCYQLLIGLRAALPPHLASALIGHVTEGPLTGLTAYDALLDPRLAGLLLERLRTPGTLGALRFDRDPDAALPAPGLTPRPLGAEQSNSSLV
ncbi:maltokinase N-terminal cap-like domain-containing protein, partial [Streptomyces beijiangensis]|nr:maltokinase [Streptomyces beijiangensis]